MRYLCLPACLVVVAYAGAAAGQATTYPLPPELPAAPQGVEPRMDRGPSRARDAAGHVVGPARAGWWNDAVFYEIFVRSFKDSGAGGDGGALSGDGIGDIPGLIEKLDYLNDGDPTTSSDLGVTGLWLMPINPSPSYHGYDVTDYTGINPQYGTIEDFRKLTGACHKRGIRVILDMVFNHCSSEHPWFKDGLDPTSATHDWFIWSDTDPGWKGPWGQKVWQKTALGGKPVWYYGLFSNRMPDLNYRNPAVAAQMLRVTDFWIDKEHGMGADGYRLDAIRHLIERGQQQENTPETHDWLRTFHAKYTRANPLAMTIGEVWTSSEIASTYVGGELDMTFEFDLAGALVESARTGKASTVAAAQERVLGAYPPNQYGRFLSNHDQTRIMTQLKGDAGAMHAAAAMLLLGPGVPFIYYGEEIGMTGDKPDENLRTPMQWSAAPGTGFTDGTPWEQAHADRDRVNVERESADATSLLSWYRRMIRVRAKYAALASGPMVPVESGHPGVYAFMRTGEQPVVVVINLTDAPVENYALSVPAAPGKGAGGTGETGGEWTAREVLHVGSDKRGEIGAKPIAILAAHEAYVLELTATQK